MPPLLRSRKGTLTQYRRESLGDNRSQTAFGIGGARMGSTHQLPRLSVCSVSWGRPPPLAFGGQLHSSTHPVLAHKSAPCRHERYTALASSARHQRQRRLP